MTRFSILAIALCLGAANATAQPKYNDAGEMLLPEGYEQWVFVGSNLGLGYRDEPATSPPAFHNVYIETEAYLSFMETAKFPDPTQFVFEVYSAGDKDPSGELNDGKFNADLKSVEAAIKDSSRPIFDDSKEIWAYYAFDPDSSGAIQQSARAMPDSACYACHIQHAGYDNVWVQFYPRLKARLGM